MREHDLDLIAALAEGRLEDETEARALIESSEEHRAEYESQKTALEAVSQIPPAALTSQERAALRRDVWTALTAEPTVRQGTPWYLRLSYAAAGVFVVIGLAAVLQTQLAPQSTSLEEAASTEDVSTTTAAGGFSQLEDSGDAGVAEDGSERAAPQIPAANLDRLSRYATEARSGTLELDDQTADFYGQKRLERMRCVEEAGLEGYEALGEIEEEIPYIVAVPAGIEVGPETPIAFIDATTCQLLHLDQ